MKPVDLLSERWTWFFDFVRERNSIWYLKEIENYRGHYTNDLILRSGKFGNVWRELDRGTRYETEVLEKIHTDKKRQGDYTIAFRQFEFVATYRHSLIPATTEALVSGIPPGGIVARLAGRPVMSDVIRIYPMLETKEPSAYGWATYCHAHHIDVVRSAVDVLDHVAGMSDKGAKTKWSTPELAHKFLQDCMPRLGSFKAYEVMTSLASLQWWPFSVDDFPHVGHGALPSLRWLTDDDVTSDDLMCLYLTELAEQVADMLKVHIPDHMWPLDKSEFRMRFTVRTLEDCLCEFRKYMEVRAGTRVNKPWPDNLQRW